MHIVKLSDKTKQETRKINDNFSINEITTLAHVYDGIEHVGTERVTFGIPLDQPLPTKPGFYVLSFQPQKSPYGSLEASRTIDLSYQENFKEPAPLTF